MRCSRCETELPDSVIYCPKCGSPIRPGIPTTFSYLPPGTPVWPSTVPPTSFYSADTKATQQSSESGAPKAARSKRSTRGLLLGALLLVLTPLVGAALTFASLYAQGRFPPNTTPLPHVSVPAATPTPDQNATVTPVAGTPTANTATTNQLPTPTSFKKTSSPDVNVSLQYPADWIADPPQKSTNSTAVLIHPTQQIAIGFIISRLSDSVSSTFQSADELNQARVSGIGSSQGVRNMQNVPSPTTQPIIAGVKWAQADAVFQNSNGDQIHIVSISVQHNKPYYNILVIVPDVYYNEALKKYFQPMLNSLQFLS